MTRVTPSMLAARYITNSRRNLTNMQKLQNQLSTGKEISRPSDNPYKVSRTMQLYSEIDANKQFNENIKDMSNWIDVTDTALDQANNVLSRIRELQVKAGNGTYDSEEHLAIQVEIKEKVAQLENVLNTNFDGAYIFGGTKSTSKPVTLDGNGQIQCIDKSGKELFPIDQGAYSIKSIIKDDKSGSVTVKYTTKSTNPTTGVTTTIATEVPINVTSTTQTEEQMLNAGLTGLLIFSPTTVSSAVDSYSIKQGQINEDLKVEMSEGVFVNYNTTAVDILDYKHSPMQTNSLSDLLSSIVYNLNDPTSYALTDPAPSVSKVSGELLTVGAMSNRMSDAGAINDQQNESMTDILSKTEDIDFTEKMMDYSTMQTVYMASLQTSAKILPMTIMNYL